MDFYGTTVTGEARGYTWNPRTGYQQVVVYTGTPAELETLSANAISNGYSVRYVPDQQGGYSSLEVTYGAAETQDPAVPLSDEWSLIGNDLEKSIFEHPSVTSEQETWEPSEKVNFKAAIEAALRGDGTTAADLLDPLPAGSVQLADSLYDELAKGVEAYTVSQFVLRHTVVITSNSTIQPVLTNVGKVYSTAALQSAENIPGTIKFSLPDGYWLKRTPTVDQYGTDKWQITQEYWHADSYSTFLYEEAT